MTGELEASQERAVHGEGRRRLRLLLCGLWGASCAAAMALVLVFYGTPFNPVWWWVMASILLGAFILPAFLAPVFEWVIAGYLRDPEKS